MQKQPPATMPCAMKETQAEIQQRTMEDTQTQISQPTQARQGLIAQRNAIAAVDHNDDGEQSDHDNNANPIAVLGGNRPRALNMQPNQ